MNSPFNMSVRIVSAMGCLAFACIRGEGSEPNASTFSGVRKILFVGNSITRHGPNPAIGWTNNWGMAASAEAKDYVHVVQSAVAELTGAVPDIMIQSGHVGLCRFGTSVSGFNGGSGSQLRHGRDALSRKVRQSRGKRQVI